MATVTGGVEYDIRCPELSGIRSVVFPVDSVRLACEQQRSGVRWLW